jgi:hypothetical protein
VQAYYNLGRLYHEAAFRARRQSEREQAARDARAYEDSDNRKEEEEDLARKGKKIDSRPLLKNGENKKKEGNKKGKHTKAGSEDPLQKAETMHLEQAESEAAPDAPQVSVFVLLY